MAFKKDFGTYIKDAGLYDNGKIIITDDFTPLSLMLYPDGLSSITANIDDMLVSFDFHDEILKVFLPIFQEFKLIDKALLSEQILHQLDQPIMVDFADSSVLVKIVGVVLTCELSSTEKSETTEEEFTPLIVIEAKVVQRPVGMLIPKSLEIA